MNLSRRQLLAGVSGVAALTMLSAPARAAVAFVTSGIAFAGVNGGTINNGGGGYNTTGANCIVAFVNWNYGSGYGTIPLTLTDNKGNTYTPILSSEINNTDARSIGYVCENAITGSGHTFTVTATGAYITISFVAMSGASSVNAFDINGVGSNNGVSSSTVATGAFTPFLNGSFIAAYGVWSGNNNAATMSGFTLPASYQINSSGNNPGQGIAYLAQSSAASVTPTWTWSGNQGYSGAIAIVISPSDPSTTVTYSVAASGGDLIAPIVCSLVTTASWSGGIVTVTLTTAHGLPTGSVWKGNISPDQDNGDVPPWFGEWNFTVTGASTVTYPVASDPGAWPGGTVFWFASTMYTALGAVSATPDLTFRSTGNTCPSTAADSAHIAINSGEPATVVGHPIQCIHSGTTVACMITSLSGTIAAVSAIAGYPANFGFTPASGDAYTIFPIKAVFNIGLAGGGSRIWQFSSDYHNNGCIQLGPWTTNPTYNVVVQGIYNFNSAVPMGSPADNGSAIVINLTNAVLPDHTGLIGLKGGYVTFKNLQLWSADTSAGDGVFQCDVVQWSSPWTIDSCVIRNDAGNPGDDHNPFIMSSHSGSYGPCTAINTYFAATNVNSRFGINMGSTNPIMITKNCMLLDTQNLYTPLTSAVSGGATSFNVASQTGVVQQTGAGGVGISTPVVPNSAAFPAFDNIGTITGAGPYNMTVATGTIGAISNGTTININIGQMAVQDGTGTGAGTLVAINTAIFGFNDGFYTNSTTAAACASDSNPRGQSGVTIMPYQTSINAGYALLNSGTIDARLAVGSSLIHAGTYDPSVPLDIFGATRPNPPSIGPMEPIASGNTASANFFHASPI